MNIISYRYTNTFKQFLLIVCMLYFILCATVIAEVVIFNVPGYEVNVVGGLLLYGVIFALLVFIIPYFRRNGYIRWLAWLALGDAAWWTYTMIAG